MNRHKFSVGITVALVSVVALSNAEGKEMKLKGTFSGSFVNTASDTNGDGVKASLGIVGTKGTGGPGTAQSLIEYVFSVPTTIQFFSGTEIITGGTGKFAGATGSITFTGTATALSEDAAGNLFGPQSGEFTGTIITP